MRWILGVLAASALIVAVACQKPAVFSTSVQPVGSSFLLENYVPLEGGRLQWTGVGNFDFTITPLGNFCKDLQTTPHNESKNTPATVTCEVPKATHEQLWAYVIQSNNEQPGATGTVQVVATVPIGPCKSCPGTGKQGPAHPQPPRSDTAVNAIYCNTPQDKPTVFLANGQTAVSGAVGSTVTWTATGADPRGSVIFADANVCGAGSNLGTPQSPVPNPSCVVAGQPGTSYAYTVTDSSCNGSSSNLNFTVTGAGPAR